MSKEVLQACLQVHMCTVDSVGSKQSPQAHGSQGGVVSTLLHFSISPPVPIVCPSFYHSLCFMISPHPSTVITTSVISIL